MKSSMFLTFKFPERKPEKPKATEAGVAGDNKTEKPLEGQDPNDYIFTGPVPLGGGAHSDSSGSSPPGPISSGVLNGKAKSLPVPHYPADARAARISGVVTVEVVIDETGEIFSAKPVSGHALLQHAARMAACGAKFTSTRLMGQPVKVSGVIHYMFNP